MERLLTHANTFLDFQLSGPGEGWGLLLAALDWASGVAERIERRGELGLLTSGRIRRRRIAAVVRSEERSVLGDGAWAWSTRRSSRGPPRVTVAGHPFALWLAAISRRSRDGQWPRVDMVRTRYALQGPIWLAAREK